MHSLLVPLKALNDYGIGTTRGVQESSPQAGRSFSTHPLAHWSPQTGPLFDYRCSTCSILHLLNPCHAQSCQFTYQTTFKILNVNFKAQICIIKVGVFFCCLGVFLATCFLALSPTASKFQLVHKAVSLASIAY